MTTVALRVRPGFTHGVGRKYKAGDTFEVPIDEAAIMLRDFADKLEHVSMETLTPEAPTEPSTPEAPAKTRRRGATP